MPVGFDIAKLAQIPEVTDDLLRLVLGALASVIGRDVMRLSQDAAGEPEDPARLSTYLSCLNEIHAIRALLPPRTGDEQAPELSEAQLIRLVTGAPPDPVPTPADKQESDGTP